MIEELPNTNKTLEDWRKIYLQRFKDFHDNFSDEIPEEMLNGLNPENHKYKVRGNWFASLRNSLDNAANWKMFPDDFNTEWRNFFKSYDTRMIEGGGKARTTKEDIDTANKLLVRAQEIISNSK